MLSFFRRLADEAYRHNKHGGSTSPEETSTKSSTKALLMHSNIYLFLFILSEQAVEMAKRYGNR